MISDNLTSITSQLPPNIQLIAVSKTQPISIINEAYEAGQKDFGENKVQELIEKKTALPNDIRWHFIGHLQTNKVKYIVPFVHLIHGVDSLKLLKEIDKEAKKNARTINCLLEFHIAEEDSKYGFNIENAFEMLNSEEFKNLYNVRLCGVMGMATFTNDQQQIRREFKYLHSIFTKIKNRFYKDSQFFSEISMGMSDDYKIAIEEGSTMVRIGSTIFGRRNY